MHLQLPANADASEQALEEVFRHTPIGVVLTDLHGTVLDANRAFCAMLKRERGEVIGRDIYGFMHPEEMNVARRFITQLRDDEASSIESTRRWVAADGTIITTRVTASVVRSRDGEPVCGIGFVEDIGERLAMEKALRESEGRYRRVVEDQTEMIVRCMPDGTRTFVNEAYCRYSEATPEQLIGTSFFPCIPEDELDIVLRKYAAMTPENPVHTEEHRAFTPQGTLRWHRWTDRGIFDAEGNLIEIQAVGRDITDEREAQDLLRRSEENYRRLHNALPVAVWETDLSDVITEMLRRGLDTPEKVIAAIESDTGKFMELASFARIVTANEAAMTMTGAAHPSDIHPWMAARYTPEAALAYIRAAASLLLGHARVADIELPMRTPDGKRLDLLQRLARQPDWKAQYKIIAIVLDVTERKSTERDLAHRRQILEDSEVLARIGSWEWDPSTDQIFGSAGFWRIFNGDARARFEPIDVAVNCFREDFRPLVLNILDSLRRFGRRPEEADQDMVMVHPDGTTVTGRGVSFAEQNEAGETVRCYGVVQDLTERRRLERVAQEEREALTRADKMISLGVLISGVAHEINNPNHSIMLNAPLLRDAWKSITPVIDDHASRHGDIPVANVPWSEMRGEVTAMIDDIEHAAERIRGIVTELRSFGLDHDPGDRRLVQLNDVVQSSLRLLGNHIRKATFKFTVSLSDYLPRVRANQRRLEQVMVNLVINACQALESPECAITIETGRTPTHVFVRVIDEGRGIAREDLRKIKDPFFTTKRATGGSGLGLAVSDRIVQEHGGELTFESAPGRGTTATVSIPAEVQEWRQS